MVIIIIIIDDRKKTEPEDPLGVSTRRHSPRMQVAFFESHFCPAQCWANTHWSIVSTLLSWGVGITLKGSELLCIYSLLYPHVH